MHRADHAQFGNLLQQYRAAAGLTQEELAERAGLSARGISDLERGVKTRPRAYTVRRLAEALGLSPEDRALFLASVRAEPPRPAETQPAGLPSGGFVGASPLTPLIARDDELKRIQLAAEVVQEGGGRLILLSGERGIGKTRLLQEAFLFLRDNGFTAAAGLCSERERDVILYPFRSLLRDLLPGVGVAGGPVPAAAGESPPPAGGAVWQSLPAGGEDRYQVFQDITERLIALAMERPIALVLDDLQWADAVTLDLLILLARRTRGHGVLLLGAYRDVELTADHPLRALIRDLDRENLIERLPIHRFSEDATAQLVNVTVGPTAGMDDFAEFVHRRTHGIPFFIHKMLGGLGGRYRLIRQIGQGGMGRVFEAIDTQTGERVAAKIMFARVMAEPDALRRFEQEGAILARLDHPSIVKVRETFVEEHAACVVMELLEGRSLRQVMEAEEIDPARARRLMQEVVAALEHAHRHGVVHRDIKPDNIMLMDGDRVVVTDFGIAHMLRRDDAPLNTLTSTGLTLGTPLYMAPEQVEGGRVDGRTDIYAVGAVFYHLVTGSLPFSGDDPFTVALKQIREAPEPPERLNPALPGEWAVLILRALAKDPSQRFPSAGSMAQALEGLSLSAGPDSRLVHSPAGAPARPIPAGVAAAGLMLVAAVILGVVLVVKTGLWGDLTRGPSGGTLSANVLAALPSTFHLATGIAVDHSGSIFVADGGADRIEKFSASGRPEALWGTKGKGPGQFRDPRGVAVDTHGNLFVADAGNNRIQELSSSGRFVRQWGTWGTQKGQFIDPKDVAVDRQGTVYVLDQAIQGRVESFSSNTPSGRPWRQLFLLQEPYALSFGEDGKVYLAVSNGIWAYPSGNHSDIGHDQGTVRVILNDGNVAGIATSATGTVYWTDLGAHSIHRKSVSSPHLASWKLAGINAGQPLGRLAMDAGGDLYVVDHATEQIAKVSPDGHVVAHWGPRGVRVPGQRKGPRIFTSHNFDGPFGIAVDRQDRVFVGSYGDQPSLASGGASLVRASLDGKLLVRGNPHNPQAMAVGPNGNVYGASPGDEDIVEYSPTLKLIRQIGIHPVVIFEPHGVAVDTHGIIYATDMIANRVLRFSPAGKPLGSFGGPGRGPGHFDQPNSIAIAPSGNLWVTEVAANRPRVQELTPAGKPLGAWGTYGHKPGQFNFPLGIAVDGAGVVYVADTNNNRIQKGTMVGGKLRWTVIPVRFFHPGGVAVDRAGNVFVADGQNNRVVEMTGNGTVLTIWK